MVRPLLRASASMNSTITWAVNALVDATPTSGPAWVYMPQSVSRAIVEPTTLQMPITIAPFSLASLSAASVSAVSPDWEITTTTSSEETIGLRYLNSDA